MIRREREHRYGGEAGVPYQLAEGEFEIIHRIGAADVRRLWTLGHRIISKIAISVQIDPKASLLTFWFID